MESNVKSLTDNDKIRIYKDCSQNILCNGSVVPKLDYFLNLKILV